MLLTPLEELLSRYKILNSYANSGEFDKWFLNKFRLAKILKWKQFENLHHRTYVNPFAKERFNKEVRLDLSELRRWYKILNDKSDDPTTKKALEMIDEFLIKIPQVKKKTIITKAYGMWKEISALISIPIFISAFTLAKQYILVILVIGIVAALPLILWLISNQVSLYLLEKYWYNISQEKLHISKLKNQLIKELIAINDASTV